MDAEGNTYEREVDSVNVVIVRDREGGSLAPSPVPSLIDGVVGGVGGRQSVFEGEVVRFPGRKLKSSQGSGNGQ